LGVADYDRDKHLIYFSFDDSRRSRCGYLLRLLRLHPDRNDETQAKQEDTCAYWDWKQYRLFVD
jgi:hypothetical protein